MTFGRDSMLSHSQNKEEENIYDMSQRTKANDITKEWRKKPKQKTQRRSHRQVIGKNEIWLRPITAERCIVSV